MYVAYVPQIQTQPPPLVSGQPTTPTPSRRSLPASLGQVSVPVTGRTGYTPVNSPLQVSRTTLAVASATTPSRTSPRVVASREAAFSYTKDGQVFSSTLAPQRSATQLLHTASAVAPVLAHVASAPVTKVTRAENGVLASAIKAIIAEPTEEKSALPSDPSEWARQVSKESTTSHRSKGEQPNFECPSTTIHEESFTQGMLSIVVLGASGDLAKKKTYPSLMDLYIHGFLPPWVWIVGYARSASKSEEFRDKIKPWLLKSESDESKVNSFLSRCTYFKGAYDSPQDFAKLNDTLVYLENSNTDMFYAARHSEPSVANRLFYFAIPPDAFLSSATSIKESAMTPTGFNRLIVEKPFGHDLESAQKLIADLGALWSEEYIYRIDHYLAKELVQNLYMFRFGNTFLEPAFNHHHIAAVLITFKEPFGTEGRGGYFTNYGIIRDVIQNHLMQVLSIVAMEAPPRIQGEDAGNFIRDAKNNVLRCIAPVDPEEVVIGQYVGADGKPGYLEDDSINDKTKAKCVATFAAIVVRINNPRWAGVPFILKAGKALNERKVDVRIQYKESPAAKFIFDGQYCARNEMVMRLQPEESVYMKINVKEPGLNTMPLQSEMDLSYKARYEGIYNPEAYTRLILSALRGDQSNFVRSDELLNSWKIFDPLLLSLEQKEKRIPIPYAYGSRGPAAADELLRKVGFQYETGYVWQSPSLRE